MSNVNEAIEMVLISEIEVDGTQTRAALRPEAIGDYAEKLGSGEEMDPCVVFRDGHKMWLAAGHHRRDAYKSLGRTELPCVVRQGSKWDAIEYGIRDNLQHRGERLSREDKRHNVLLALRENHELADVAIAELCGVSDKTVTKCRRESESSSEIPKTTKRVGRDGRRRDTGNIGRRKRKKPATGGERVTNGRAPKTDASEEVDPQPKHYIDASPPAPQLPSNPGGDAAHSHIRDELRKCWGECCRKLGKLQDQLCDLFELTKRLGSEKAKKCRADRDRCQSFATGLGEAIESWRRELGISDE